MSDFGDFGWLCQHVPSYPWCNLFYRQLQDKNVTALHGLSANSSYAPVGIDPQCGIPFLGHSLPADSYKSLSNIAQIVASGLSILVMLGLILGASRRRAAVGRVEVRFFFILYTLSLILQILTTGAVLQQGTTAIVVLTAIHAGVIAALFWTLLANGVIATQVVEDGTMSSLIPYFILTLGLFAGTLYVALDTGLGFTKAFVVDSGALKNLALFVLVNVWPGAAAVIYFFLMIYIILFILRERRPLVFFALAFILFVLSQLDFLLLNQIICKGANHKVDGSFVATILETAAVVAIFLGWRSITEESWDDDAYYYRN